MTTVTKKRKVLRVTMLITGSEVFKPFEIKLPANAVKVTGIMVTARQIYGG